MEREEKAKYLAQYIGQTVAGHECDRCNFKLTEISFLDLEVGLWGDWSGGTHPQQSCNDLVGIDDVWLNLKPLDQITDEDLVMCYHLHSGLIGYDYTMDFKPVLEMAKHWVDMDGEKHLYSLYPLYQYLQSKSYALPWMQYSVPQLIEEGVLKLRTKE